MCIKSVWIVLSQLHLLQLWDTRCTVWLCNWEAIGKIKNSKGKRDNNCVSVCMSVNTITRLIGQSPPLWLAIASGHWVHLPNLECNSWKNGLLSPKGCALVFCRKHIFKKISTEEVVGKSHYREIATRTQTFRCWKCVNFCEILLLRILRFWSFAVHVW